MSMYMYIIVKVIRERWNIFFASKNWTFKEGGGGILCEISMQSSHCAHTYNFKSKIVLAYQQHIISEKYKFNYIEVAFKFTAYLHG